MQHPQLFRPTFLARAVFAAAVSFACTAQAGLWEAVVDTTPAGYARQSSERPGDWASFWSDTKEGTKRIFEEGNSVWIVPTIQPGLGKNGMKKTVIPSAWATHGK